MFCGNILDQLLDQHRFSNTGAAKKTDLSTLCVRSQKVDDLDSGLQYLHYRALLFEGRRISVNLPVFLAFQ